MNPRSQTLRRLSMLLAASALLITATTASAVTRFASPTGTGSAPCAQADPCTLPTAVAAAGIVDEVRVLPGNHVLTSTLSISQSDLLVQGEPGAPKPTITYTGPAAANGIQLDPGAVNVHFADVTITGSTDPGSYLLVTNTGAGAVFDRVNLRNTGGGHALVGNVDLRNSVVTAATVGGVAAEVEGTIVGSTIIADADPASRAIDMDTISFFAPGNRSLTVINSIVRGGNVDISLTGDILSGITFNIDYSAYGGTTKISAGPFVSVTEGTHNVVATPLLVGIVGGANIHQVAGSPTIDAGNPAVVGASTGDIDGQPRTIGSAPDIGADEFAPVPAVTTSAATAIATTSATLNGTVNPNGLETSYHFEYGPTVAYGSSTPTVVIAAGTTVVAAAAALTGLAPNTTFHARLVATNLGGTTNGTDVVLTTLALPVDPPPVVGPAKVAIVTVPTGRSYAVRFSLSERARVTVTVEQLANGRVVGGKCRITAKKGKPCTKLVRRRTIVKVKDASTAAQVLLPPATFGKPLPGRYRIRVVATDLVTGQSSNVARTSIRVVVQA